MIDKRLGKIGSVKFGHGGYQDVCLGLHLTFEGDGWGVSTDKSTWDPEIMECGKYCKWTEVERSKQLDDIMRYLSKLLKDAKVDSVDRLVGKPVEVEFEDMTLKTWRILTEVL